MSVVHVFIDTNVFEGTGYNFSDQSLVQIEASGQAGDLILISPDSVDFEIKEHMELFVREAFNKLRDFTVLNNTHLGGIKRADRERMIADSLARYSKYLEQTKAIKLSISPAATSKAWVMYKAKQLPFHKGAKQHEFKDAFSVNAIDEWLSTQDKPIDLVICSGDQGVRDAFQKKSDTHVFSTLKDVQSYIAKKKASYPALKLLISTRMKRELPSLKALVKDEFRSLSFEVDSGSSWAETDEDITNIDIGVGAIKLLSITKEELFAECPIRVSYDFSATRSKKVYDSVDNEEISIGTEHYGPIQDHIDGILKMDYYINDQQEIVNTDYEVFFESDTIIVETEDDEWEYPADDDEGDQDR